ncbi:hypothetical protein E2C01_015721 [Portunus trituberculatus]|uniref:Uncharacterized protein n=1 Tax=Portunus trituberculatus TaxID=210409 RepID=A0A5B7DML4_PORTR|nr:hypothetical protein [Portunus trituberculatus]
MSGHLHHLKAPFVAQKRTRGDLTLARLSQWLGESVGDVFIYRYVGNVFCSVVACLRLQTAALRKMEMQFVAFELT